MSGNLFIVFVFVVVKELSGRAKKAGSVPKKEEIKQLLRGDLVIVFVEEREGEESSEGA